MKRLWAPWRMRYVQHAGEIGCFFCRFARQRRDAKNFIVERGRTCFAILNRFPYNVGHFMVAPLAHKGRLGRLTDAEVLELWRLAAKMQSALDRALRPHGYNIGINLGRAAGAGVPGHLHLHVVPRWKGDTNFMPVTGGAKVMPMALSELYRLVRRTAAPAAAGTSGRRVRK